MPPPHKKQCIIVWERECTMLEIQQLAQQYEYVLIKSDDSVNHFSSAKFQPGIYHLQAGYAFPVRHSDYLYNNGLVM